MIITHRRRNLVQAWLMAPNIWTTYEDLQQAGAYGSKVSVDRAMRKLEAHGAAARDTSRSPRAYRFTSEGLAMLGHVPASKV